MKRFVLLAVISLVKNNLVNPVFAGIGSGDPNGTHSKLNIPVVSQDKAASLDGNNDGATFEPLYGKLERNSLFGSALQDNLCSCFNGLKLAQLRFYDISTTVP